MGDIAGSQNIAVRQATADDEEFLFRIYAETRAAAFSVLGWEAAQLDAFLKMQFMMRCRSYAMQTPGAETFIAEIDGRPAATFITDRREGAIELVDIAVSLEMRKRGLASGLLERIMDERLPIDLTVENHNAPAMRLYEKLGFRETGAGDVYKKMRWTPDGK
jgi:ribosomal protein S18 acetylase RimI-like enzyme